MNEMLPPNEDREEGSLYDSIVIDEEKLAALRFNLIARDDLTQLHLTATDGFVLSRVENQTDFNSLISMTGLPRKSLLESLSKLICFGLLTAADQESDRLLLGLLPVTHFSCLRSELPIKDGDPAAEAGFEMAAPDEDEPEPPPAEEDQPPQDFGPPWIDPAPAGSLRNVAFAGLVDYILTTDQSGVLTVESAKSSKQVFFKRGKLLFVESISIEEELCLGQILLNFGKISQEELALSRQKMEEQGKRQGEILVEMQAISPRLLAGGLKKQIELKFTDLYSLKDGVYKFEQRADFDYHDFDFSLHSINFRAAADKTPAEKIRMEMSHNVSSGLKINSNPTRYPEGTVTLSDRERKFIEKIERADTISRAYVYSPHSREKTQTLLYALSLVGYVEFVRADGLDQRRSALLAKFLREKEYLATDNYFEVLEIHWTSPFDEISLAHRRLIEKYTIASDSEVAKDELLDLSHSITDKIDQAFQVLSDDALRKAYRKKTLSTHDIANGAEIQFRKGENFLYWQEEYDPAIFHLESAVELMPENSTYLATLALALFSKSRVQYYDENHRSIRLLNQAYELDEQNPVVYFCHGMILKQIGKPSEASRKFESAILLDPKYSDAQKALESI
jgi:tetratricopeptide (TPR) repeat protein